MDQRTALPRGTVLPFPGMACEIEGELGRGSNAIVYVGSYADLLNTELRHRVLIKELFPYHTHNGIYRDADGVHHTAEAESAFALHRQSFESGNRVHLRLLSADPDGVGGNVNTFSFGGTLYTVLGFNGGRSLSTQLTAAAPPLRTLAVWMLGLLDALEGFHREGYLHLDIAPDNILLTGSGRRERVLLIDYNSALPIDPALRGKSAALSVKQGYTAPEVRMARLNAIGPAADLYSVTAVFFRCLTGAPLTPAQLIRPVPPDVSGCPALTDAPETVRALVRDILCRGLASLPRRRFGSVQELRELFCELLDRIDGVGITHWALWEAGRRNLLQAVRDNPALRYLEEPDALYPAFVQREDGTRQEVAACIDGLLTEGSSHTLLTAPGGMGKTTALLRAVLGGRTRFSTQAPAVTYLSLYGAQRAGLLDRLLETLKFKPETGSYEAARHALRQLLSTPLSTREGTRPTLLLLLDGLNEAAGDREALLEQIRELSGLRGVRLLVTSRTDEPTLNFTRWTLCPLEEAEVQSVLGQAGLLLPESPELRALLQTPLLLSMFVQSAAAEGRQLQVQTQQELLDCYLDAMRDKALRELPEDADARWRVDAALRLVLPATAQEMTRRGEALDDASLLRVVERCYRLLSDRLLMQAFPEWIGRSHAIRGEADTAEEWFGLVVHDILWKQLGLLVRTPTDGYQLPHELLREVLCTQNQKNAGAIRKRRRRRTVFRTLATSVLLALLAVGGFFLWKNAQKRPYDEDAALDVLCYGAQGYSNAGLQYEAMCALLDTAQNEPSQVEDAYQRYEFQTSFLAVNMSAEYADSALSRMVDTGDVFADSGEPIDESAYMALVTLSSERAEEYGRYAVLLCWAVRSEPGQRYHSDFPALLRELVNTDAQIAAILYQLCCVPNSRSLLSGDSVKASNYQRIVNLHPLQDVWLPNTTDRAQLYSELNALRRSRENMIAQIASSGIEARYRATNP